MNNTPGVVDKPAAGPRKQRQEWNYRPDVPLQVSPLFLWPLDPVKMFKWVWLIPVMIEGMASGGSVTLRGLASRPAQNSHVCTPALDHLRSDTSPRPTNLTARLILCSTSFAI